MSGCETERTIPENEEFHAQSLKTLLRQQVYKFRQFLYELVYEGWEEGKEGFAVRDPFGIREISIE
jgi:hypothetical protein